MTVSWLVIISTCAQDQSANLSQRLGGDSISSMRLVASAQAEQLQLSFIDIFKNPKLADLAKIGSRTDKPVPQEKAVQPFELLRGDYLPTSNVLDEVSQQCRIPKSNVQDAYPTSPLQDALLTLSIKQPGAYVAQHVLTLPISVEITKFKAAWEKAVHYQLARSNIACRGRGGSSEDTLASWWPPCILHTCRFYVYGALLRLDLTSFSIRWLEYLSDAATSTADLSSRGRNHTTDAILPVRGVSGRHRYCRLHDILEESTCWD
jgi:aryl carrier-like protein